MLLLAATAATLMNVTANEEELIQALHFEPFTLVESITPYIEKHYPDPFSRATTKHLARHYNALAFDLNGKLDPDTIHHLQVSRLEAETCLNFASGRLAQLHAPETTMPSLAKRRGIIKTQMDIASQLHQHIGDKVEARIKIHAPISEQPPSKEHALPTEAECLSQHPLRSTAWLHSRAKWIVEPL